MDVIIFSPQLCQLIQEQSFKAVKPSFRTDIVLVSDNFFHPELIKTGICTLLIADQSEALKLMLMNWYICNLASIQAKPAKFRVTYSQTSKVFMGGFDQLITWIKPDVVQQHIIQKVLDTPMMTALFTLVSL